MVKHILAENDIPPPLFGGLNVPLFLLKSVCLWYNCVHWSKYFFVYEFGRVYVNVFSLLIIRFFNVMS